MESFEGFTEVLQSLNCDSVVAESKSTLLSYKNHLLPKVEADGL